MNFKNKKLYNTAIFIFSIFLLIALTLYAFKSGSTFSKLQIIDSEFILGIITLYFFHFLFLGLTQKIPLDKNKITLPFHSWFGLCMSGELLNNLLPAKGGTAIRMIYLKRNYQLSFSNFLSIGFAVILASFTILGIVGFIYTHFYLNKSGIVFSMIESIFLALSLSGVLLILLSKFISTIFKFNRRISPGFYLRDYRLILKCTLLYLGIFALYPIKLFLAFKALHLDVSVVSCFEISLVIMATSLFQVLPGNMGIKEVATAYLASQFGINFELALIASLIDRAIMMILLVPVGSFYYWKILLKGNFSYIKSKTVVQTSP